MTASSGGERWVVDRAKALGFDLCGAARVEEFPEFELYREWVNRGYAGEMRYLEDARRADPTQLSGEARSVIVCGLNYNSNLPYSTEVAGQVSHSETSRGWISRYAWGDDYHEVMWKKLNLLVVELKERYREPFWARAFADTGPVAERVFAKHAGLGWLGKNTLLINEELGSWLFLGAIVTSLELDSSWAPAEAKAAPDLCGNCRQCLDACPTEALVEPYVMDARRCISYLTIELRGSAPEELREAMGRQVYGCDICQDVCPYNRKARVSALAEFHPREAGTERSRFEPPLEWLLGMDEEEFRRAFRNSAVKRAKWAGLIRNACIAAGNANLTAGSNEFRRIDGALKRLEESGNPTITESARWARRRIKEKSGQE